MVAVPTSSGSLLDTKRDGADIRVIFSVVDALRMARAEPEKEIVFFSIGFETTTAPTAAALASLALDPLPNFSLIASNRVIPPALDILLASEELSIDGLILPGHVSVIIGTGEYLFLADRYRLPCAIAGFEPVDLLVAIRDILEQIRAGKAEIKNSYPRAVLAEGNLKAKKLMAEVFEERDGVWRGLGLLPGTGLGLRPSFQAYDAMRKFGLEPIPEPAESDTGCICPRVMLGLAEPEECPGFAAACRPENPLGPCMVSEEGTCRIRFEYGGIS
jgi:hydrogenase expression/formation protein HypD